MVILIMIFKVTYSQRKDVWNHLNTTWKFNFEKWGRKNISNSLRKSYPKKFQLSLRKAKTKKQATKSINDFLNNLPKSFHNKVPIISKGVEVILNENKKEVIESLERAYKKKFPFKVIRVYLTTANMCPYSYEKKWYMTGINFSKEQHLNIAKHELNHFMYYYYHSELKKKLSRRKFELIKEALAILTNPEGNDKPEVRKLENRIKKFKTADVAIKHII